MWTPHEDLEACGVAQKQARASGSLLGADSHAPRFDTECSSYDGGVERVPSGICCTDPPLFVVSGCFVGVVTNRKLTEYPCHSVHGGSWLSYSMIIVSGVCMSIHSVLPPACGSLPAHSSNVFEGRIAFHIGGSSHLKCSVLEEQTSLLS